MRPVLQIIFSVFGIRNEIKSDNGLSFDGLEFVDFRNNSVLNIGE